MNQAMALELARDAILNSVMLGGPLLLVAMAISILVSVIQAVTQVQDQTLAFVPKLFAVAGALIIGLSWFLQTLVTYAVELFRAIPSFA